MEYMGKAEWYIGYVVPKCLHCRTRTYEKCLQKGNYNRKELPDKLLETGLENMGILGNTSSGCRRNKWVIAAERYIIWHFQINRSAFCYSLSLIAITQLCFKIQPVRGSFYSCCSKHTMFDWSLSGKTHWLTDKDVIYCSSLFVLHREMSSDKSPCLNVEGKERHLRKVFINRTLIRRLCSTPTVRLTGDVWEVQCRNITAMAAETDGTNSRMGTCRLEFEATSAQDVSKSWGWILILTPCPDSLTKPVRFFQRFPFEYATEQFMWKQWSWEKELYFCITVL